VERTRLKMLWLFAQIVIDMHIMVRKHIIIVFENRQMNETPC
jgi:hypothetical protein